MQPDSTYNDFQPLGFCYALINSQTEENSLSCERNIVDNDVTAIWDINSYLVTS